MSGAEEFVDWDLRLAATFAGDAQKAVRFLLEALPGCGGWLLSRSLPGSQTAEISFEFARSASVEIYGLLIGAGLDLSSDAHLRITSLCQCTRNLLATRAGDLARIRLLIFPVASNAAGVSSKMDLERNP